MERMGTQRQGSEPVMSLRPGATRVGSVTGEERGGYGGRQGRRGGRDHSAVEAKREEYSRGLRDTELGENGGCRQASGLVGLGICCF